jgi:hypothetical protein
LIRTEYILKSQALNQGKILIFNRPDDTSGFLDYGYSLLDAGYWMLDTGYWMLDAGYWILGF